MTNRLHNLPQLKERRRQLRNALMPAEALLWRNLQRSPLTKGEAPKAQGLSCEAQRTLVEEC